LAIVFVSRFQSVLPALDTYRAANLLIDQHRVEAATYAAGRADQLLEKATLMVPRCGGRSSKRCLWDGRSIAMPGH